MEKKRKEMADQYTWGLILGAVLGLVAVYNLGLLALYNLVMRSKSEDNGADSLRKTPTPALNGECPFDADVIVVGAGVAGAALANTLAKVIFLFLFFQILRLKPNLIVGNCTSIFVFRLIY